MNGGEYQINVQVNDPDHLEEIVLNIDSVNEHIKFFKESNSALKNNIENEFIKLEKHNIDLKDSLHEVKSRVNKSTNVPRKFKSLCLAGVILAALFCTISAMNGVGLGLSSDIKDASKQMKQFQDKVLAKYEEATNTTSTATSLCTTTQTSPERETSTETESTTTWTKSTSLQTTHTPTSTTSQTSTSTSSSNTEFPSFKTTHLPNTSPITYFTTFKAKTTPWTLFPTTQKITSTSTSMASTSDSYDRKFTKILVFKGISTFIPVISLLII